MASTIVGCHRAILPADPAALGRAAARHAIELLGPHPQH